MEEIIIPECPCQKHKGYESLKVGMIVDVYIQQDNGQHKFEGKAKLIEKLSTWYSPEPFPIVEHCPICRQTTNNIKEKWLVQPKLKDTLQRGNTTHIRYIHKFHSHGTPHVRDIIDMDEENYEDEEKDEWYEQD